MRIVYNFPDSKVHGPNMGPTWVLAAPNEPHVGPMNLAISVVAGSILYKVSTLLVLAWFLWLAFVRLPTQTFRHMYMLF